MATAAPDGVAVAAGHGARPAGAVGVATEHAVDVGASRVRIGDDRDVQVASGVDVLRPAVAVALHQVHCRLRRASSRRRRSPSITSLPFTTAFAPLHRVVECVQLDESERACPAGTPDPRRTARWAGSSGLARTGGVAVAVAEQVGRDLAEVAHHRIGAPTALDVVVTRLAVQLVVAAVAAHEVVGERARRRLSVRHLDVAIELLTGWPSRPGTELPGRPAVGPSRCRRRPRRRRRRCRRRSRHGSCRIRRAARRRVRAGR